VIDNDIGQDTADEWSSFIMGSDLTAASVRAYLFDYYRKAPFQKRHIDLYARYFRALAEADGPVLVHCAAGKDRTGILCALTHHITGVHDDDIQEDYLLTNDAERLAKLLPLIREGIRGATGRMASDEALMTVMRVEPEYLAESFAAIREENGSLSAGRARAGHRLKGARARSPAGLGAGMKSQVRRVWVMAHLATTERSARTRSSSERRFDPIPRGEDSG
jgi:protein tyrosine/serine phosphatase